MFPIKKDKPDKPPEKELITSSGKKVKDYTQLIDGMGTASTMGLHMVSGPIVGGTLGYFVDRGLDTWPWGAGIGLLLGIAAGFRNVWMDGKKIIRQQGGTGSSKSSKHTKK